MANINQTPISRGGTGDIIPKDPNERKQYYQRHVQNRYAKQLEATQGFDHTKSDLQKKDADRPTGHPAEKHAGWREFKKTTPVSRPNQHVPTQEIARLRKEIDLILQNNINTTFKGFY